MPETTQNSRVRGRSTLLIALLVGCVTVFLVAPLASPARPKQGIKGGVSVAWPKVKKGKPHGKMAKFLARQVGGRKLKKPRRHKGRARISSKSRSVPASTPESLRLVRSIDIPGGDPSYKRLLNLSFTYDSELAATAFAANGDRKQAEQLLDQLAALQRGDGSIAFSFNTLTGASDPLTRTGVVAWLGLAAESYRQAYDSNRYAKVSAAVEEWLAAHQLDNGLIVGGPDQKWVSTQHNLIAYFFLRKLAANSKEDSESANALAERIQAGIDKHLLVDDGSGLHFTQGLDDSTGALDTQTLGILYLVKLGLKDEASRVADWMEKNLAISDVSIELSSEPATFNETYSSPGPFSGYRPYTEAPDLLWMEGTLEARIALATLGRDTGRLDESIAVWRKVGGEGVGPLMANRTDISTNNEYHVWPVSATASWTILSDTGFGL